MRNARDLQRTRRERNYKEAGLSTSFPVFSIHFSVVSMMLSFFLTFASSFNDFPAFNLVLGMLCLLEKAIEHQKSDNKNFDPVLSLM